MHYAGVAAAFCFGACHRCPHYFFAAHGWILYEAEGLRFEPGLPSFTLTILIG